jgi:hypothetical protein
MSSYGQVNASQIASTMPSATIMQNAATGNGNGTSLNVQGYATAILSITASVAMGGGTTINFEASVDDTTWVSIMGLQVGTTTTATSTTATGDWMLSIAGYKSVRARISAYSTGTITVTGYSSVLTIPGAVSGGGASGNVNINQIAGNSVATGSGTATSGTQRVAIASPVKAGYSYTSDFKTPAASTTDICQIKGSSTKKVEIHRVAVVWSVFASLGGAVLYLKKRDSVMTGGTSVFGVPLDSNDATATASVVVFTANPSAGSEVGILRITNAVQHANNPEQNGEFILWDAAEEGQTIKLISDAESVVINCNGDKPAGSAQQFSVHVLTTEE